MEHIFPIVKYPAAILQKRAEEMHHISFPMDKLAKKMIATMRENDGIGLAGPQVNLSQRIIVVQDVQNPQTSYVCLNPRVIKKSRAQTVNEEGCLSLPGIFLAIKRSQEIELVYENINGEKIRAGASGLMARIFQHEIDHLNGKLIIHRVGPLRRLKIGKQLQELRKHD